MGSRCSFTEKGKPCNVDAAVTKTQRNDGAKSPWSITILVRAPRVPGALTSFSRTRYHDLNTEHMNTSSKFHSICLDINPNKHNAPT